MPAGFVNQEELFRQALAANQASEPTYGTEYQPPGFGYSNSDPSLGTDVVTSGFTPYGGAYDGASNVNSAGLPVQHFEQGQNPFIGLHNNELLATDDPQRIADFRDDQQTRMNRAAVQIATMIGGGTLATGGGFGAGGGGLPGGAGFLPGAGGSNAGLVSNIINGVSAAGRAGGLIGALSGGGSESESGPAPSGGNSTGGNVGNMISSPGGFNFGNIFLPGGLQGGAVNTTGAAGAAGGYGGSPLNEADYNELNRVYGAVSDANNFSDINWNAGNFRGTEFAGNKLSPEAQKFLQNNWGAIKGAKQLSDVSWQGVKGTPGYAPPPTTAGTDRDLTMPGATPGASTGGSLLGDLEPARGAFAGLATQQAGQVGQSSQGNILELMRQQAAPQEQKAFQGINQNLFSRGRLGANDSATGEAYAGFARGQAEADTGRQLASYGLADQLQTGALNRSLGAAQGASGLTALSTLPFDMALKLASAQSQASLGSQGLKNQEPSTLDSLGGLANIFGSLFGSGGSFGSGGRWGG